jgi:hypothetical protein
LNIKANVLIRKRPNEFDDFESTITEFDKELNRDMNIGRGFGIDMRNAFIRAMKDLFIASDEVLEFDYLHFKMRELDDGKFLLYIPNTNFRAESYIAIDAYDDLVKQIKEWIAGKDEREIENVRVRNQILIDKLNNQELPNGWKEFPEGFDRLSIDSKEIFLEWYTPDSEDSVEYKEFRGKKSEFLNLDVKNEKVK